MLNELITWVLNTYLGKYLEDFNPAQLSIALASGEVELENVPIRKDALRSFGIPVQCLSGCIGKIKLQIPVRQFRSSPWCIVIERVYGVFGPKDLNEWDTEKEKQSEYEYKLGVLDTNEANWRVENDCHVESYYSLSYSSWLNYGASLATNILENLELKINEVHLRYEDNLITSQSPFACGIRIQSLSAQSCDSHWNPSAKNFNNQKISYKLLELKNLYVYWDKLNEQNTCSQLLSKQLLNCMNELCEEDKHFYIINPVNASAKFKRERCKEAIRSRSRPRISCDILLPEVKIALTELQYNNIITTIYGLQYINRIHTFKILRPTCPIENNGHLWWNYAVMCHGFIFQTSENKWRIAKENMQYIRIFKKLLLNPTANISKEEKQLKMDMEKIRTLDELKLLRNVASANVSIKDVNVRNRNLNQGKGILYHWFPNWLGWYGSSENSSTTSPTTDESYTNIEDDILVALKETIENDAFTRRDFILGHFKFALSDGSIAIKERDRTVLFMEFTNLISFCEVKPKFSSYRIGISMGSVTLHDKLTDSTEFPLLIRPQIQEHSVSQKTHTEGSNYFMKMIELCENDPWFLLQFEKNHAQSQTDYRLVIKSKSLDIVYNEHVFEWILSFFQKPIADTKAFNVTLKKSSKWNNNKKFFKNWRSILTEKMGNRKKWSFEIDISAPRIICAENCKDKNTSVLLIDFGRFELLKNEHSPNEFKSNTNAEDSDEELFMTPCSTPPGSQNSRPDSPTSIATTSSFVPINSKFIINKDTGLERDVYSAIYDKYLINLTDLQILVCKNREFGYACSKNSSNSHILDKFNISLQVERRIINTLEPECPSITLFGNLSKIVAHVNEQKIIECFKILNPFSFNVLKFTTIENTIKSNLEENVDIEENVKTEIEETANAIIIEFVIGQIILELQSREKSIAELQIIGAKASMTKKSAEVNINMMVHGLLLVDAIQSFGPDFELLVASHRHVEMDSISGSLKQSEPCSPICSGSPDPNAFQRPTSPHAINKAVNDLQKGNTTEFGLEDALITIDIHIIEECVDVEPMQIVNITFNSLDVIANQETIVELLGFGKRILDHYKIHSISKKTKEKSYNTSAIMENTEPNIRLLQIRTDISFDFHRLNILVLRSVRSDNLSSGRKVGTLTMSEAKINATVYNDICIAGALGGIQVIDITPEGFNHQRIFSVGKDPLTDPPDLNYRNDVLYTLTNEMYKVEMESESEHQFTNALKFRISHHPSSNIEIKIRMASVWYTHCPRFLEEIFLCVKEFEQYFKHFMKSLRNKASHMAKGLVQHINANNNPKIFNKFSKYEFDVILSSPVLVLPKSCQSSDVLVANLGKITVRNTYEESNDPPRETTMGSNVYTWTRVTYFVDIRNINLFSLNTEKRKDICDKVLPKAYEIYSCKSDAVVILDDTAMLFQIMYDSGVCEGISNCDSLWVEGKVTQNLQVSLSKVQYEQLIESLTYATNLVLKRDLSGSGNDYIPEIIETDSGNLPQLSKSSVKFSVPLLKLNLKNEHSVSLIHLTFTEFSFLREENKEQKEVQILLESVLLEDLKCPTESKFRNMVDSSCDIDVTRNVFKSKMARSCPDLSNTKYLTTDLNYGSTPTCLNREVKKRDYDVIEGMMSFEKTKCNEMAIQDSSEKLVIYKSLTKIRSNHLLANTKSSIQFNSLNLIISLEKWYMVFDFFGLISYHPDTKADQLNQSKQNANNSCRELFISVRSLNLMLVRNELELAKANISNISFNIHKKSTINSLEGRLGSISILDLTPYGHFYQEKFSTLGHEALNFSYYRLRKNSTSNSNISLEKDAELLIHMSSVKYVHTKRFIIELNLFVKELLQLQSPVISRIKNNDTVRPATEPLKIGLDIRAESPIILLPVSYHSKHMLIANLGRLTLTNSFKLCNGLQYSKTNNSSSDKFMQDIIVDEMKIDLVNINVIIGEKNLPPVKKTNKIDLENFGIVKLGNTIFKDNCFLKIDILRNTGINRCIPDIRVNGTLSKLNGVLNLEQYKLIRGFLNFNLGETIDDVYYNYEVNVSESIEKLSSMTKVNMKEEKSLQVWNTLSINFILDNVQITLAEPHTMLACVMFIKSTLDIDSFSDGSQDIDLISSEILLLDARQEQTSDNIFKYILKPSTQMGELQSSANKVQAEVHSRKRNGVSKYTILLNNMRIMSIMDYLERLKTFLNEEYIFEPVHIAQIYSKKAISSKLQHRQSQQSAVTEDEHSEFVLNITNSEIVFIENNDKIDSNAIILKSTTVLSYKPQNIVNPISLDINHLEIFSCILGSEKESSLSIIDPFTLNLELRNNCLQIQVQNKLYIRVSYNDVMLFTRMMRSIPKQNIRAPRTRTCSKSWIDVEKLAPLEAMGFNRNDCLLAMELNNHNLNESAIWLSQRNQKHGNDLLKIISLSLNANCISICVIDDCLDADVPLLEMSLSRLTFNHSLQTSSLNVMNASSKCYEGSIETILVSDYYNRRLSGWEPIIEPWECSTTYKFIERNVSKEKTMSVHVTSKQILRFNVTTTLIELSELVRKNWTEDYLRRNLNLDIANVRRRLPFVPFAIKNLTGEPLLFKVFYSHAGGITRTEVTQQDLMCNWISAQPNEVVHFDFGPQTKLRHFHSHKLNMHQILVQIHGWTLIGPISIDKVGVFFRYSNQDVRYKKKTRIVFKVTLIGSAQKLITVQSALNIVNKTNTRLCLKMQRKTQNEFSHSVVEPNEKKCVPLRFIDSLIYLKPFTNFDLNTEVYQNLNTDKTNYFQEDFGFSSKPIQWANCGFQDSFPEIHNCFSSDKSSFNVLTEISKDKYPARDAAQLLPGHTINIMPPLKIKNLLCCDLLFKISGNIHGRISASQETEIYSVDIKESFSLNITLDNYKVSGEIKIPMGHCGVVEPKLKIIDVLNRELLLRVSIQSFPGKGIEIFICAPFWIINKTALPLIFRQEGTSNHASGQFDEHEYAREVSPLMFSFSDQEGSSMLEVRLGKSFGNANPWCKGFGIHKETAVRELKTEKSKISYVVGINVQRGKGIYCYSTFVILSPRYQLYNRSSYVLQFAQKCDVFHNKPDSVDKIINALPGCNFPFHWPNCEQDHLMCVRIKGDDDYHWSNALPINETKSIYINIRNELGDMIFLRLEVLLHGGTYLLNFTDAHTLPPPLRIDNYSEVPIFFFQKDVEPYWRTNVKPLSSLSYVLDDALGPPVLNIDAPGGNFIEYPLNEIAITKSMTYANFIYIAFKETFISASEISDLNNSHVDAQNLVLGVKDKQVVLAKKVTGDRSQLWLMNSYGQLEHEGSSPPSEYTKLSDASLPRLVLDLEKPPNPSEYTKLVVRPPNNQRNATQTWRFESGRLMCHANMCVQAMNGVYGLQPDMPAVLGRIESTSRATNMNSIPFEQCIEIQKLRPGSGHLEILSKMDGPIKCIQIRDVKCNLDDVNLSPDPYWKHASVFNKKVIDIKSTYFSECMVKITLTKGLGLSIVTRSPCEELAYVTLENIMLNIALLPFAKTVDLTVADLQIDNQLLDTQCPVMMYASKSELGKSATDAIVMRLKLLPSPNKNAIIFEYFSLELKPCTVLIEERFILKTALFLRYGKQKHQHNQNDGYIYHIEEYSFSKNAKRMYFENLLLGPTQIRLTVLTAPKLSSNLMDVKKSLGLTLIKFEDAVLEFDKFLYRHNFETIDVYVKTLKVHYINQLKWHAAAILGSVDFLGNPLGFANDLSEGVSGLIFEGSVKSLVKNVTHGISNSTAKLTETLSDSLGRVVLDDHDNEIRQKILEVAHPTTSSHLAAGLKGFAFGILGGVTSMIRQPYVGAQSDGFPGFLSGIGKGIVGTVTKPLIGVLDLASETATAVRETSRGSNHCLPDRKRLPRCVMGAPGGLLPSYSYRQSKGQQYLYIINGRHFNEKLIFYEPNLCNDKEAKLRLLVSSETIRIFSRCDEEPAIMFECHLSEVLSCHPLTTNVNGSSANKTIQYYYIEISTNIPRITRPRVRCQNEEIAERASRCINYAKAAFDDRELSLFTS